MCFLVETMSDGILMTPGICGSHRRVERLSRNFSSVSTQNLRQRLGGEL